MFMCNLTNSKIYIRMQISKDNKEYFEKEQVQILYYKILRLIEHALCARYYYRHFNL